MIAIHKHGNLFTKYWISYCEEMRIQYKLVDCYANDIIDQLKECTCLMWHFSQNNPKDILIAKQILFALEHTGLKVFPDFKTAWHFDDKLGQKYLLERIKAPMVRTYVFFEKAKALEWAKHTTFPKVFKLRGGAGSSNVKLARSYNEACSLIKRSFGSGFSNYDKYGSLKERWRKFKLGKDGIKEPLKGLIRLFLPPPFAKVLGIESGYVYFQDFLENNLFDIRVIVIGAKAFALKRFVRNGDFRASGSGSFAHGKHEFDERCIQIAFDVSKKLATQCLAYDFVFDESGNPLIVEISYGYSPHGYVDCPGYWDDSLVWHEGKFNSMDWMVDLMLKGINR